MKSQIAVGAATALVGLFGTAANSAAAPTGCKFDLTKIYADVALLRADAVTLPADHQAVAQATVGFQTGPSTANQAKLTAAAAKVATDTAKVMADWTKLVADVQSFVVVCT